MDYGLELLFGSSVIALFIGFLTGIFGVGGGFLMTPVLMILLGLPGNIAVGTGLAAIFANSSLGMFKRRYTGTVDVKLAFSLAGGSIIGALIGLAMMESLKNMPALIIFGREQIAVQYILLCLFLLILMCLGGILTFDLYRNAGKAPVKRVGLFSRIKLPPYMHFNSLEEPRLSLAIVVVLGLAVGILTGLLGVGGGVVILPGLIYLIGQRTVKAAGTSLLIVWISSMVGMAGHWVEGNIKPVLLVFMLAGVIIGTNLGTYVGLKLAGPKIRCYFIYMILLAAIMVAFKLYGITFA